MFLICCFYYKHLRPHGRESGEKQRGEQYGGDQRADIGSHHPHGRLYRLCKPLFRGAEREIYQALF